MSILSSHAWATKPRRNVYFFLVVLVSTGVAAALLTVDAFNWHLGPLALLGVYLAQTVVYMSAVGELLIGVSNKKPPAAGAGG